MEEAGRVADDVGRVVRAVDGDDAVRDDALDAGAHELDVVLRRQPSHEPLSCSMRLAVAG